MYISNQCSLCYTANIMTVHRTKFDLIVQGLAGSEGPVFDASGEQFFMVAPEVEVDGKAAGQVLSVNIFARKVF